MVYANNVKGAALYGILKPKILMTAITNNLISEEKKHIFIHELIHLKYKEIWFNWITIILAAVNWFNPIVLFCFYKIHQDCEFSCDEKVMLYLKPTAYKAYANTIINMADLTSKANNMLNSTALVSNKMNIRR